MVGTGVVAAIAAAAAARVVPGVAAAGIDARVVPGVAAGVLLLATVVPAVVVSTGLLSVASSLTRA
jgi:hypothetical protein